MHYKLKHAHHLEKSEDTKGYLICNDPGHVDELQGIFGLEAGRDSERLSESQTSEYGRAIGKLMWLSHERPDIKFMVSVLAGNLAQPKCRSWRMGKRLVRYLQDHPQGAVSLEPMYTWHSERLGIELHIAKQEYYRDPGGWDPHHDAGDERSSIKATKGEHTAVESFVHSDWATDKITRRSMSGGCLYLFGCLLHSWARRQTTVSLSSAEAQLGAMTIGMLESIGLQNLLHEVMRKEATEAEQLKGITLRTDSAATRAVAMRSGGSPGVKHLSIKQLYVQECFAKGVRVEKVRGTLNPADLLTKMTTAETLRRLRPITGLLLFGGKTEQPLKVEAITVKESRIGDAATRMQE
eukprot:6462980-Amphidinium_carterae.1